jgi:hypothetical protein
MATGSADGSICVWNFDSGKLVTKLLAYDEQQQQQHPGSSTHKHSLSSSTTHTGVLLGVERAVEQLVWLKTKNGAAIADPTTTNSTETPPASTFSNNTSAAPQSTSTPRGLLVSSSSDGCVRFWDVSRSQLLMCQRAAFRPGDSLLVMKTDVYSPPLQLQFAEQQRKAEAAAAQAAKEVAALKSPLPPAVPVVKMVDAPKGAGASASSASNTLAPARSQQHNALQVPSAFGSMRFPFDNTSTSASAAAATPSAQENADGGNKLLSSVAEPADQEGFLFIGDQAGMLLLSIFEYVGLLLLVVFAYAHMRRPHSSVGHQPVRRGAVRSRERCGGARFHDAVCAVERALQTGHRVRRLCLHAFTLAATAPHNPCSQR